MTTELHLGASPGAPPDPRQRSASRASSPGGADRRDAWSGAPPSEPDLLLAALWRLVEVTEDPSLPTLDRIRALVAVSKSLDRLFMTLGPGSGEPLAGAAPLEGHVPAGTPGPARREAQRLARALLDSLRRRVLPALQRDGIEILDCGGLDDRQRQAAGRYFDTEVFPVLTPLALDPGRPFPQVSSLSLNLAVLVREGSIERFARVKVPQALPRLLRLDDGPGSGAEAPWPGPATFVWLEALIAANVDRLFPGFDVVAVHQFHVTRRAPVAGTARTSQPTAFRGSPRTARLGPVIRLVVSPGTPARVARLLAEELGASPLDVQRLQTPLATSGFEALLRAAEGRPRW